MPQKGLLDPQGKAVQLGLSKIGLDGVSDVFVGKRIKLSINADSQEAAIKKAEEACKQVLVNAVMEDYTIEVV
jgi:phosphoribosylformylglycinamidine synthase